MKIKNFSTLFFKVLFIQLTLGSLASAGGLVGSGAGFVEMNFQYAYSNLGTWIDSCLKEKICESGGQEGVIYEKIVAITKLNRLRSDRLEFFSAKAFPEKFDLGINEPNRIAVTSLDPNSSIIINVDLLYSQADGQPLLDIPVIAGLLIHEIGHQTGEKDHDFLNLMSAQMRAFLERSTRDYYFDVGGDSNLLEMTVINKRQPVQVSTLNFNWGNKYSKDLSGLVSNVVKCSLPELSLSGFEIFNGYFLPIGDDSKNINFNFWLKIYCYDLTAQFLSTEKLFLQINLSNNQLFELRVLAQ